MTDPGWMTGCAFWGWVFGYEGYETLDEFRLAAVKNLEADSPAPRFDSVVIRSPAICLGYVGVEYYDDPKSYAARLDAPNGLSFTFGEFLWLANEATLERMQLMDHRYLEDVHSGRDHWAWSELAVPAELDELPFYGLSCGS